MPININSIKQTWKKILSIIETSLNHDPHVYETFFSETKLLEMNDEEFIILAPSNLCKQYLLAQNNHSSLLKKTIKQVMGKNYKLSFFLEEEYQKNNKKQKNNNNETEVKVNNTFFANSKLNPNYTFDNFVVGDCNKEAIRAALLVANEPAVAFNPLFIYSKSGLGKTHLLHAIGNYYKEKHPSARVLTITTDSFIDEFVKYVQGNTDNYSFKDFFKNVDLLLVDDIQFLADKVKTAEQFFYIFNALVNNGKQIVLTSDRHPKDLKGLEDRLVSRFNMGLSVNITSPDTQTLLEILKRKIISHGLDVKNYEESGLVFLAETFCKNVRELEGALNRLLFLTVSLTDNKKINLEEVKDAVNIMLPKNNNKSSLSPDDVIEEVAKYYHISAEQIKSPIRTAQVALARRISMYLCRFVLGSSYPAIGTAFKRDHSTVITAVDKVVKEIKLDSQLNTAISNIKKGLKK